MLRLSVTYLMAIRRFLGPMGSILGSFGKNSILGQNRHLEKIGDFSSAEIFENMAPIENLNLNSHGLKSVKEPFPGVKSHFGDNMNVGSEFDFRPRNDKKSGQCAPSSCTRGGRNFSRHRNFWIYQK